MTILDHLFIVLFAVAYPVYGFFSYRRELRRIAAGESISRANAYLHTIAVQWILFIIGVVLWASSSRSWSLIGLRLDVDLRLALGLAVVIAGVVLLVLQIRQIRVADKAGVDKLANQLGDLAIIVPRTKNELTLFYGVSVTAGIVEEFLWRGVLIWYLSQYMPIWAAAAISTIGFAVGHSYQGLAHVPGILFIGTVFAGLYLLTGSIWPPIVLHILVDIFQGRGIFELMHRKAAATSSDLSDQFSGEHASAI